MNYRLKRIEGMERMISAIGWLPGQKHNNHSFIIVYKLNKRLNQFIKWLVSHRQMLVTTKGCDEQFLCNHGDHITLVTKNKVRATLVSSHEQAVIMDAWLSCNIDR